jgi:hypothetical protein
LSRGSGRIGLDAVVPLACRRTLERWLSGWPRRIRRGATRGFRAR